MENFTPVASTVGGVLIGLAVAALYLFNGRILGISNIASELVNIRSREARLWRIVFIAGLVVGGLVLLAWRRESIGASPASPFILVLAGLLVGYGSSLGRGCTSGHGICGISRLSPRSIVATLTFMCSGIVTVYVVNHLLEP